MNKQLPVFAAIRHTFSLTFNNLGPALRLTWAWMVIFFIVAAAFAWIISDLDILSPDAASLISLAVAVIVMIVVAIVGTASIAVAWHRYILLDEGGNAGFNLRLDGTVLRYAGNVVLVSLGAMTAFGIPAVILMSISEAMVFLILPAMLALAPFMYRFFIKLPAIALGRHDFGFSDALDVSRGNYWPIAGLVVVYFLVAFAINLVVAVVSLVGMVLGPLEEVVDVLAMAVAEWIGIIFGISLLTTLYGFFVEGRSFDD